MSHVALSLSSVPKALNLHKYTPVCFAISVSVSLSLSPWDPKALLLLQFPLPTRNQSATSFLYFSAPKTKPLPVFSEKTKPFLFIIIYIYIFLYIYIYIFNTFENIAIFDSPKFAFVICNLFVSSHILVTSVKFLVHFIIFLSCLLHLIRFQ